jgi:hypothetical protein
MKKYGVILFSMIMLASQDVQGMAARTWNSQNMTIASHRAFGKDWIFKSPIDANGLQVWESECAAGLKEAKNYVSKLKKTIREELNKYISDVDRAHYDLVNNIKITYNSMFSPATRKSITTAGQERLNKKIEMRPLFDTIVKNMSDLKARVMSARKRTKSSSELAAYDILDDLAQQIMNVARTAAKSVDFLE